MLKMALLKDRTDKWIREVKVEVKVSFFFQFPWAILCATQRSVPLPVRHAVNACFLQVYVYVLPI